MYQPNVLAPYTYKGSWECELKSGLLEDCIIIAYQVVLHKAQYDTKHWLSTTDHLKTI